ncbi:hypothetical protein [Xanthomonas arboricola]|uniref:Uncharacterized protein n=1 Tax=Xanthomonas arboricola TaxID=56448 RepID=A0AAU9I480_9XANT|nr:hypothetical protein [Xanthomonas arboricola]CAE6837562.1 hypothetical protein XA1314C_37400 [Xanthomonas arboricola]CAE6837585.1 hypothetical protein XA1314C_37400 [Xanthomonas arboricola]
MARRMPPDPELVRELREMQAAPKIWVAAGEIAWVDAGGRPKGYKFRAALSLEGYTPDTLYVEAYYKESTIEDVPDKLSLSLFYRNHRILGLDENGATRHRNGVGVGRQHYLELVGHPHLHTISDDAVCGYAEPLESAEFSAHWATFLSHAGIENAPVFSLPPGQRELPL